MPIADVKYPPNRVENKEKEKKKKKKDMRNPQELIKIRSGILKYTSDFVHFWGTQEFWLLGPFKYFIFLQVLVFPLKYRSSPP